MDNINDIISSLTDDDINMLKGVASSILGGENEQNPPSEAGTQKGSSNILNQSNNSQQNMQNNSMLPANLGFDNIDFDMIMKAKKIFDRMNNIPNKDADLIMALKPHLRPEIQNKADQAMRILKLFEVLPYLKELF